MKNSCPVSFPEHVILCYTLLYHAVVAEKESVVESMYVYLQEQAERLTLMYTVGYSVSLGALVIAVFIMLYCR